MEMAEGSFRRISGISKSRIGHRIVTTFNSLATWHIASESMPQYAWHSSCCNESNAEAPTFSRMRTMSSGVMGHEPIVIFGVIVPQFKDQVHIVDRYSIEMGFQPWSKPHSNWLKACHGSWNAGHYSKRQPHEHWACFILQTDSCSLLLIHSLKADSQS